MQFYSVLETTFLFSEINADLSSYSANLIFIFLNANYEYNTSHMFSRVRGDIVLNKTVIFFFQRINFHWYL